MEITNFYQPHLSEFKNNFALIEQPKPKGRGQYLDPNHKKEYYQKNKERERTARRIRYKSKKLGLNFKSNNGVFGVEVEKPPNKTRQEINHTYYLKNRIRYLDTSRKQYLIISLKKKLLSTRLNKFSGYRRADLKANYQAFKKKELCYCSKDRKNKTLLLHCALNSKEKRTSTKEKVFNLSTSMTDYKEMRDWEVLKRNNGEVSIRGGGKVGNLFQLTADFDFLLNDKWADKPWHFKYIEPWRTQAIEKNFEKLVDYLKVCPRDTKHGGHLDINACCQWPNLNFYHQDTFKGVKKNIGDTRGKRKYAVVDAMDKFYRQLKGHKLSWRLKCYQEKPTIGEEVGKVKTCLDQFIEILAKFNFIAEITANYQAKNKADSKTYGRIEKSAIFKADWQAGLIKPLTKNFKTSNWEPWAIFNQEQTRYFVLNASQRRQKQALQKFKEEPRQAVQLYQGDYQLLFHKIL